MCQTMFLAISVESLITFSQQSYFMGDKSEAVRGLIVGE